RISCRRTGFPASGSALTPERHQQRFEQCHVMRCGRFRDAEVYVLVTEPRRFAPRAEPSVHHGNTIEKLALHSSSRTE
ncbi:MAG: hypothetical protein M3R40_02545, partial [Pseudomonadota bacterium]|nr:hypothetical protein [Pseudomonadota bacterium]